MRTMRLLSISATLVLLTTAIAGAHCEVPCGIYDDRLRTALIAEHAGTIEKAMGQIKALSGDPAGNANQLVRWVTTKEEHATKIQHIVSQYFLTQRIKPDQAQYERKLAVLHQILIAAMKCKQTTDPSHVTRVREQLAAFEALYFGKGHQ
jgi:nickel superoxide dismutase